MRLLCVLTIFPEKGLVRGSLTIMPSGVWQAWDWSDWLLRQSVLATLAADMRPAALHSSGVQYFLKLAPRIQHQEPISLSSFYFYFSHHCTKIICTCLKMHFYTRPSWATQSCLIAKHPTKKRSDRQFRVNNNVLLVKLSFFNLLHSYCILLPVTG